MGEFAALGLGGVGIGLVVGAESPVSQPGCRCLRAVLHGIKRSQCVPQLGDFQGSLCPVAYKRKLYHGNLFSLQLGTHEQNDPEQPWRGVLGSDPDWVRG